MTRLKGLNSLGKHVQWYLNIYVLKFLSEVMSTSFCGQALACEYAVKNKGKMKAEVIQLPEKIDDDISRLQLEAMGISIDVLTAEQKKYLESWEEGT